MELFKTEERRVRDILSKKEIYYKIPRNQRDYVWEIKQWKEFFNDIVDCIEVNDKMEFTNAEYFIGSCVLEKHEKKCELIVDGQQRLTTITIILSVLYDLFEQFEQTQLLEGIYSYIYRKNDDGEEHFTIKNENLDPYFSEVILYKKDDKALLKPIGEQQIRVSKCYEYYKNELLEYAKSRYAKDADKIKFLVAFRSQLLDLKIIEISVSNELDGYTVFEILNAKGKQLQLGDRLKNLILKKLPKTFPTDQAKAKWDNIKNQIEAISKTESSFSNFISHYWISSYQKLKDDDEIYYDFKAKISKVNIVDFLNDLEENAKAYSEISLANSINTELRFSLNSFKIFRNTQVRPFLLSLFHNLRSKKITEKDLLNYVRRLENFHFVFSAICSTSANKIEKTYHHYSPIIKNNFSKTIIESFYEELNKERPDYIIFERNFSLKGFSSKNKDLKSNRSLINYMLQRIEYQKRTTQEFKISDLSIEHIKNDDGTETTSKIGNLLPIAQTINNNCGDETFKEKIEKYKRSEYQTVKDFLQYNSGNETWEVADIKKRTDMLADLAYNKIWSK
ncbi:MAG: DUF262 domain-containing protein [Bacteroidia bacterium]